MGKKRNTFALLYLLSAKIDLGPVARQSRPEKYIRLDSPVGAGIEHSRPPKLILGKVNVSIRSHRKRIRPRHPGIPCKNVHGLIRRIK